MRRHNGRFATMRTYRVIRQKGHLESISVSTLEGHGQEEEKEEALDHPVFDLTAELGFCYHNEIRATELIANGSSILDSLSSTKFLGKHKVFHIECQPYFLFLLFMRSDEFDREKLRKIITKKLGGMKLAPNVELLVINNKQ